MAQEAYVNTLLGLPDNNVYFGTAVPTAGTYKVADLCVNTAPSSGAAWGWVCTTAGTPGTWRSLYLANGTVAFGTAIPTTGTYVVGDIVYNTSATAGAALFWVCVVAGTPGTWRAVYPMEYGTAAPNAGAHVVGDVKWNTGAAKAGDVAAWFTTVAGTPGTVKKLIAVDRGLATVTAAAALTAGSSLYQITAAGPYTLMAASSYGAGFEIAINTTGAVTLVAASANTLVGDNTIAANAAMRWTTDGASYWVRSS